MIEMRCLGGRAAGRGGRSRRGASSRRQPLFFRAAAAAAALALAHSRWRQACLRVAPHGPPNAGEPGACRARTELGRCVQVAADHDRARARKTKRRRGGAWRGTAPREGVGDTEQGTKRCRDVGCGRPGPLKCGGGRRRVHVVCTGGAWGGGSEAGGCGGDRFGRSRVNFLVRRRNPAGVRTLRSQGPREHPLPALTSTSTSSSLSAIGLNVTQQTNIGR